MHSKISVLAFSCMVLLVVPLRVSFAFSPLGRSFLSNPKRFVTRDEYLQPHFEACTLPKPLQKFDFDYERIVECANLSGSEECSLDEMEQMMQELEQMEHASSGYGAFLSLDATDGTIQALSHALESKVELSMAQSVLNQMGLGTRTEPSPNVHQPSAVFDRNIQDLIHQLRDIAQYEEY